ncbi:MAG: ATP-binding protein [Enhygromyxa sp.]
MPTKDARDDEFVVPIRDESDLGSARMLAREICKLVDVRGYQAQKVVTAVSELARNIVRYSHGGRLRFRVDPSDAAIIVVADDEGPGIPNLDEILSGNYRSRTGLGRGLLGSRDLADRFDIQTSPEGTTVTAEFRYGRGKP